MTHIHGHRHSWRNLLWGVLWCLVWMDGCDAALQPVAADHTSGGATKTYSSYEDPPQPLQSVQTSYMRHMTWRGIDGKPIPYVPTVLTPDETTDTTISGAPPSYPRGRKRRGCLNKAPGALYRTPRRRPGTEQL